MESEILLKVQKRRSTVQGRDLDHCLVEVHLFRFGTTDFDANPFPLSHRKYKGRIVCSFVTLSLVSIDCRSDASTR